MSKTVVRIVVAILAAGAVGGGGYALWRMKKNKKEAKENEALEVTYIPYKHEMKGETEEKPAVVRDQDDTKRLTNDIRKEKFAKQVSAYVQTEGEKENFELYLAGLETPEEEDGDEEDDEDDGIPGHHMDIHDVPYGITAAEFCNTRTYYDKVSLNYFGEDDVVADDRDEIMENADKILGDLKPYFEGPRAPSIIYIRNEELEVDYEVSYVDGSYRKEVLHLDGEA